VLCLSAVSNKALDHTRDFADRQVDKLSEIRFAFVRTVEARTASQSAIGWAVCAKSEGKEMKIF